MQNKMTSYSAISLFDSGTTSQCSTCNTTPVGHGRIDPQQPWPAITDYHWDCRAANITAAGPLAGFAEAAAAIKARTVLVRR